MTKPSLTRVLAVDPANPDPGAVAAAADIIRSGGLVAFPTETVYGLGANALDAAAVGRIFSAKGRPASDPIIAHICDVAQLDLLARAIPPVAYDLARHFWPGPLTLVLPRGAITPANLSAGRDTVAVRMPAHPVALALIRAAGVPIAAPSANRFSRPSPTTAAHVLEDLDGKIELVLDGGSTSIGVESSVVDLTSNPPVLLRPGGAPLERLQEWLPGLTFTPRYLDVSESAAAPGMLLRHYAPDAPVTLIAGERSPALDLMRQEVATAAANGRTAGILAFDEDLAELADLPAHIIQLGSVTAPDQIAANLFAALRDLERTQVDFILVRDPGDQGLSLAIRDRLVRAAEGRVVQVMNNER